MPETSFLSTIHIDDYDYPLPTGRIAKFPLPHRDASKLLIHSDGQIAEDHFYNVARYLPADSLLVLNNTRVVRARLQFHKPTGAAIEIFCLEPVAEIEQAFAQQEQSVWKCLVGNARRWKDETLRLELPHKEGTFVLEAEKQGRDGDAFLILLKWQPQALTFSEVLELAGQVPLPPYLNREAVNSDANTYQTVYAQHNGSVAAPTAGLHFTDAVFEQLIAKNIATSHLTLHVGAGTFKPVGQEGIARHQMHTEQLVISRQLIETLLSQNGKTIAVGTTSVRTLESLYWYGVQLIHNPDAPFYVSQYDPYQNLPEVPVSQSLTAIADAMDRRQSPLLPGATQLLIVPGYRFNIINGMITNFHQPRSTLLLLIAAWLGPKWKEVYEYALSHQFRFLSYGDSCLFL
ncbi:MAG: S-adenosylmethionine:tRNA ribosyltransferase-isomerase [Bacteroidales bacterium]|jgi:S-adenosylmethionine:tRNA ribosyltransferase-isomerase|nr:S-adenosylmethionine:tRNA ribosyltransferase-isomerase [Bacteroidales bacterium]MDD3525867.1 S-adenosylmethionine:tRNA ribosyltransferase-isomerase [Bacteroidales bacterium]MDD4741260.1 S-adenosylmethionine:tRNA ribosyltransferase-isomerase [Bacteroidales bacterium]MDY0336003.1 S-adenosylmethionine:tRNA ribosyltransferase-isomerase [Bacteroidales bacterium]NCU35218.1 S-adenosylmethionine:tRNA ribosyltransferase-isomerase [Candidatus Falkowbacteria bacterium]